MKAFAAEQNDPERESLIDTACAAFPEYSDIIRGVDPVNFSRSTSSTATVIIDETRKVSDNEEIRYIGYSDGTALIASTSGTFSYSTSDGDYEIGSGATHNTITIKVTSSQSNGILKLENIKYSLYQSTYDRITSAGTISVNNYCRYDSENYTTKLYEDSSGDAYIRIILANFKITGASNWGMSKTVDIIFKVGSNRMTVDLYAYDD